MTADTPGKTSAGTRTTAHRGRLLLAVVSAVIFFDALDLSITQIALPAIQTDLEVATSTLPWIAAAYVVTYGGFLMLGGRASDLLGSNRVFLTGLAIFGVASLACGLAGSPAVLIAARAVQGVGAALTVPAAIAILANAFPDERSRVHAFGVFAAAGASGFTAGLVFGGLITSGLSWRWIFLAKVPAVAVVLVAAVVTLSPVVRRTKRGGYDLAGAVTVTAGAVLVMYGVTRAGSPGASASSVAVPLAIGAGLLAAFFWVERTTTSPLLPLRLLRLRSVATADAAAFAVLAAPFGVSYVATVYLQGVQSRPAWHVAVALLPGSVASVLVSRYLAPSLLERFGLRAVYAAGLLIVAAGDSVLIGLIAGPAVWIVVAGTMVSLGLGMGLAYPAATFGGVHGVEPTDQGAAAGLNNTALQIGGGLGLAIVATAVTAGLRGGAPDVVAAQTGLQAARWGAVAATAVPMVGALVVLVGMDGRTHRGDE